MFSSQFFLKMSSWMFLVKLCFYESFELFFDSLSWPSQLLYVFVFARKNISNTYVIVLRQENWVYKRLSNYVKVKTFNNDIKNYFINNYVTCIYIFFKNILINFERIKYFFIIIFTWFFLYLYFLDASKSSIHIFFYFLVKIYFYDHNKFLIKKIFFIKTKNTWIRKKYFTNMFLIIIIFYSINYVDNEKNIIFKIK
jgi:hypothetical protein